MSMMLHNKRAVRDCSYGCCTEQISNRTLRAREKRAWVQEQWADEPAPPFPLESAWFHNRILSVFGQEWDDMMYEQMEESLNGTR